MVNLPKESEKDREQQECEDVACPEYVKDFTTIENDAELKEVSTRIMQVQMEASTTEHHDPSKMNIVVPETSESRGGFFQNFKYRLLKGILEGVNYVIDKSSTCFLPRSNSSEDEVDLSPDESSEVNELGDGTCSKVELKPFTEPTRYTISDNFAITPATAHGTHAKLEVYSMQHKRGVLFFVNIINFRYAARRKRKGAEHDRDNLVTLFRELGYEVFYYEDLTQKQFVDVLRELVNSDYLHNIDSFVMCIQSHGDMRDIRGEPCSEFSQTLIEFHDGRTLGIEQIVKSFSNQNCQSLATKPKVFLFPCCRGTDKDLIQAVRVKRHHQPQEGRIQTDGVSNCVHVEVPTYSDILICYATLPGFEAHRDTETGTWYITELCKVIAEHAHDSHIEDILKILAHSVMKINFMGKVQVASTENRGFTKFMYFNPKI